MREPAADPELLLREAMAFHRQGLLAEAERSLAQALKIRPGFFQALYAQGIILAALRRDREALDSLDRAIKVNASHPACWNNRASMLRNLGRYDEALDSFARALALKPDYPVALYNRANVLLLDVNQPADALKAYDRALALRPDFVEAWNNRGNALVRLGRLDEALASYERALAINPDFAGAINSRAQALLECGRTDEAIAGFMRSAALVYGDGAGMPEGPPSALKNRHDREQQDYLASRRGEAGGSAGARLPGRAVSPAAAQTQDQWRERQIAIIDDFLTSQALDALRRFCLEEPIWQAVNANGYLAAFPETGFACPLLGQIAGELGATFPAIFRGHPLLYMWAFKYDSALPGTPIHADEAAVNVNFWLTPDAANLDPQSGGLILWDRAAPLDWHFAKFNSDTAAIRGFLSGADAGSVTVPHRANRAVVFDSDLFHETDTLRFREGYLNRRINVTMLFGRRQKA